MDRITKLIRQYQQAQNDIVDEVNTSDDSQSLGAWEAALSEVILLTLGGLYARTERWTAANMRPIYEEGYNGVATATERQFKAKRLNPPPRPGWTSADASVVGVISDNLNADLTNAITFVGRNLQDDIRQAGLEASLDKSIYGHPTKQAKDVLIQKLADQGVPAIRTRDGKFIQLDAYADMTVRSNAHSANNMATLNYANGIGRDLVKMSSHWGSCEICAPYQGRVFSRSGNDPSYPYLYDTPWSEAYQSFHPRCRHVLSVYIEELQTPEENAAMMEFSNRSFDPGGQGWTKAQMDTYNRSLSAYNKGQAAKTKLYQDKKQYFKYQEILGSDKMPKNFASFRRMKYNNNGWWSGKQTSYKAERQRRWVNEVLSQNSNINGYKIFRGAGDIPEWAKSHYLKWTPGETDALKYYTGHSYTSINGYLRGSMPAGPGITGRVDQMTAALGKTDMGENVVLWRGASFGNFVEGDALKKMPIDQWAGRLITDKAFVSTSMLENSAFTSKEVFMQILAPAGKLGGYLEPITAMPGEYEMLLQRGATFKIRNVETRGGKYFMQVLLK